MSKIEHYIEQLKQMNSWDTFLMQESNLPGPRANLELMEVVAMLGTEEQFLKYLSVKSEEVPPNTPQEFLFICGVVGLGRLIKEGKKEYYGTLREFASDEKWRVREAVAIALQIVGENQMDELLKMMEAWAEGNCTEQRAAAAALCEPKLLHNRQHGIKVLNILHKITDSICNISDRKSEEFKVLKKGLAYCWSVAICAAPDEGKALFEEWIHTEDKDIIWILKENLKKNRLIKLDENWVNSCINGII